VKRLLALAIAALAAAPATASASTDAPVMSVSVVVEIGSAGTAVDAAEETPACAPQLTMRLAQRPVRWRRGVPVLATGRSYRFAGRLTCAPAGTIVDAGDAGTFAVGPGGRIAARIAYRGGRTVAFRALDAAVSIAVRSR
jgi:hypothetical protein